METSGENPKNQTSIIPSEKSIFYKNSDVSECQENTKKYLCDLKNEIQNKKVPRIKTTPSSLENPEKDTTIEADPIRANNNTEYGFTKNKFLKNPTGGFIRRDIGQIRLGATGGINGINLNANSSKPLGERTQAGVNLNTFMRSTGGPREDSISFSIEHDLRHLLAIHPTDSEKWREFYEKFGIEVPRQELKNPKDIQVMALRFVIANQNHIPPDLVKHTFFAQMGVEIQGGMITIREDSSVINTTNFRSILGISTIDSVPVGWSGYYHRGIDMDTTRIGVMLYSDSRHSLARFSIDRISSKDKYEKVARLGAYIEGGSIGTRGHAEIGVTRENIGSDGQGRMYGLGLNTHGPVLKIGNTTYLFGDTNRMISLSAGGIYTENTRNPGHHVSTSHGEVLGEYGRLFQMIVKDGASKKNIHELIVRLHALSQKYPIETTEGFVNSLKDSESLARYISYLDRNRDFLLENAGRIRSIQFASTSDWLGGIRGIHGTSFTGETGLLTVRDINETLDASIFEGERKIQKSENNTNTSPRIREANLQIHAPYPLSTRSIQAIEGLISRAKSLDLLDRLSGKTLEIQRDSEDIASTLSSGYDSSRQVIRILESDLMRIEGAGIVGGEPSIEGWGHNDVINIVRDTLGGIEGISAISRIRVVEHGDSALANPYNGPVLPYSGENGILTIDRGEMDTLRELSTKKANGTIGFFEKIRLRAFAKAIEQAQVYPIVQFEKMLREDIPSTKTSLQRTMTLSGKGILYDLRPSQREHSTQHPGQVTRHYDIFQNNSREHKGHLDVTLTQEKTLKISINESEHYELKNPQNTAEFMAHYPEISKLIFGTTEQGPDGKMGTIQGILRTDFEL